MEGLAVSTSMFQGSYSQSAVSFYGDGSNGFAGQGSLVRNGTDFEVVPKSPAFVFGERVVRPLIDSCWGIASRVDRSFSKLFQWPPGAQALETETTEECKVVCSPLPGDDKGLPEKVCQETCKKSGVITKITKWGVDKLGKAVELSPYLTDCMTHCQLISSATSIGSYMVPLFGPVINQVGLYGYYACIPACVALKASSPIKV